MEPDPWSRTHGIPTESDPSNRTHGIGPMEYSRSRTHGGGAMRGVRAAARGGVGGEEMRGEEERLEERLEERTGEERRGAERRAERSGEGRAPSDGSQLRSRLVPRRSHTHLHALAREAWGTAVAGRLRGAIYIGSRVCFYGGFPENLYRSFLALEPPSICRFAH